MTFPCMITAGESLSRRRAAEAFLTGCIVLAQFSNAATAPEACCDRLRVVGELSRVDYLELRGHLLMVRKAVSHNPDTAVNWL